MSRAGIGAGSTEECSTFAAADLSFSQSVCPRSAE